MSQSRTLREKIFLSLAGGLTLVYVLVEYVGEPLYLKQKRQECDGVRQSCQGIVTR